jgi:hypothetical protein
MQVSCCLDAEIITLNALSAATEKSQRNFTQTNSIKGWQSFGRTLAARSCAHVDIETTEVLSIPSDWLTIISIYPLSLRLSKSPQARNRGSAKSAGISTARLLYVISIVKRAFVFVTKIVSKRSDEQRPSVIMSDIQPKNDSTEKLLIIYDVRSLRIILCLTLSCAWMWGALLPPRPLNSRDCLPQSLFSY